jgi:hypothetical protein
MNDDDLTAKERVHEALEPLVQAAFVFPEGQALQASIAISLRRIADVLQGFGDHPDNANSYGETGMRAVQGTLERTASSIVNEVSMALHHMRGSR